MQLGEMPIGHCIARLNARTHYLESAPIHFLTDPPGLAKVTDAELARMVQRRARPGTSPRVVYP